MTVAEEKFSKKFDEAAAHPKYRGAYDKDDALVKGMTLVEAKFKDTKIFVLADKVEDRIYSAKFFAYGGKVSVAIGETLCNMIKGLTIDEACSLKGEDIEVCLRDEPEVPAVPESKNKAFANVEELLKVVQQGYPAAKAVAEVSASIDKNEVKAVSSAELSMAEQAWMGLSKEDQIIQINIVLDDKVRPALMSDGGNVQVLDVVDGENVMIQYQGACGSCGSSLGATLSFMEQALRKEIHNELIVVPNM
jgi:NifU-like protein